MFQLTKEEIISLRPQNATLNDQFGMKGVTDSMG